MSNEKPVMSWTAEECYQYLATNNGVCTPDMSLEELQSEVEKIMALAHREKMCTDARIEGLHQDNEQLGEHYVRLRAAALSAMHCLLHVDADITERIEVAKEVAEAIGHPWPPYEILNAFGHKVSDHDAKE